MGASKNGQRIMCSVICTPPVEPAARRGWGIKALEIQKRHPKGCLFSVWARQDLNPRPSGYENVDNFEIPFFLWNLVTI